MKNYLVRTAWSLEANHYLYSCVIGVIIHIGLLYANAVYLTLALILLVRFKKTVKASGLAQGVWVEAYLYSSPLYDNLIQIYPISQTLLIIMGGSIALMSLWWLWARLCLGSLRLDSSGLLFATTLFLLDESWLYLQIAYYQMSPALIDTVLSHVYAFGHFGLWLYIWGCYLGAFILGMRALGIVFAINLIAYQHHIPSTGYLEDVIIFPEGQGRAFDHGNAIASRRLVKKDGTYHVMVGVGDVHGHSEKKHLIPWIEGGYEPGTGHRFLYYHQQKILVLICYDALFSDLFKSARQSDLIVAVSNLEDLSNLPFSVYYKKYLRYIHLMTGKPIIYQDTLEKLVIDV